MSVALPTNNPSTNLNPTSVDDVNTPESPKGSGPLILDATTDGAPLTGGVRPPLQAPALKGDSSVVVSTGTALTGLSADTISGDIYSVMALFQQMAQTQRNAARELRQTETQAQVSDLLNAAQQMRDAAEDRMTGAIFAGAMQIVGGIGQIAGGATAFGMNMKGAGKTIESGELLVEKPDLSTIAKGEAEKWSAKAGLASALGQGSGGIAGGIGAIFNATKEQEAAGHDARRSELEASAKVHDTGAQQANDMMQQMMDVIRDVRDKLGAMEQSRAETIRGIARNI